MTSPAAAVAELQSAVLNPSVIRASGAGKAYQSVAQSAAIAVQDSVDNLRNISAISTTAVGVAMAEYIASGGTDAVWKEVIQEAQGLIAIAVEQLTSVGTAAAGVVSGFPSS